eukprot:c15222_g1_i1.p1 GENE.c15222_g1_i1~~c15222_g1_i1.p1  ORF type:complete len:274 (+),score=32.54 c15222_g1_i1:26-823(+)
MNAEISLALSLQGGAGSEEIDLGRASAVLKSPTLKGDPIALALLGRIRNVQGARAEAVALFEAALPGLRRAAHQGDGIAQWAMGYAHCHGLGVEQSEFLEVAWFRRAVRSGDTRAMCGLAFMHCDGKGGAAQNEEESISLYCQSAEVGDAVGQYNMGLLMQPRNTKLAIYWYTLSAKKGYTNAQFNLACLYQNGADDMDPDPVQGAFWFQKGADRGDIDCQFELGISYELGIGLLRSRINAIRWYRLAATQGCAKSVHALLRLKA